MTDEPNLMDYFAWVDTLPLEVSPNPRNSWAAAWEVCMAQRQAQIAAQRQCIEERDAHIHMLRAALNVYEDSPMMTDDLRVEAKSAAVDILPVFAEREYPEWMVTVERLRARITELEDERSRDA